MHDNALAAVSAMIADGIERSVRLAAAAAMLALLARRRGKAPRVLPTGRARPARPDPRCDEESRRMYERDRRRPPWADLAWSVVILLLLTVVVYTVLHGADVLTELDDLSLAPGGY
jgi:predicted nucleic acid-binding Zn ribbon protein